MIILIPKKLIIIPQKLIILFCFMPPPKKKRIQNWILHDPKASLLRFPISNGWSQGLCPMSPLKHHKNRWIAIILNPLKIMILKTYQKKNRELFLKPLLGRMMFKTQNKGTFLHIANPGSMTDWRLKHQSFQWLFQLDDSKSIHVPGSKLPLLPYNRRWSSTQ